MTGHAYRGGTIYSGQSPTQIFKKSPCIARFTFVKARRTEDGCSKGRGSERNALQRLKWISNQRRNAWSIDHQNEVRHDMQGRFRLSVTPSPRAGNSQQWTLLNTPSISSDTTLLSAPNNRYYPSGPGSLAGNTLFTPRQTAKRKENTPLTPSDFQTFFDDHSSSRKKGKYMQRRTVYNAFRNNYNKNARHWRHLRHGAHQSRGRIATLMYARGILNHDYEYLVRFYHLCL